jgi:hypothetical protein
MMVLETPGYKGATPNTSQRTMHDVDAVMRHVDEP